MLVDSHCHLEFPEFAPEREAVIARARAAGVGHMLTISTRTRRFAEIAEIAEANVDVSCSVGTHPHHAAEEPEITAERLVALAQHPKVVAFGETGLDYHYDNSPRPVQEAAFRNHIRAALEADLPIIVHTRDAEADTIRVLREEGQGGRLTGVIHCFSSSRWLAEQALELGFHISFSGIVTFKRSDEIKEVAKACPVDRLLVETDAPFLAPVPLRGRRNEPAFVVHTASLVAELRETNLEDLAEHSTRNFFALFRRASSAADQAR
jgi:TatD DNase family protein